MNTLDAYWDDQQNVFTFRDQPPNHHGESWIKFEVIATKTTSSKNESEKVIVARGRIDGVRFALAPTEEFAEVINLKDVRGWHAGIMRLKITYDPSVSKFHLLIGSVLGVSSPDYSRFDLDLPPISFTTKLLRIVSPLIYVGLFVALTSYLTLELGEESTSSSSSTNETTIKMTWVDASYYSVSLLSTIGYGDIHASDQDGKIASIALSLCGFLVVSLLLTHFSFIVLDKHDRDIRRIETETEIDIRAKMEEHPGTLVNTPLSPSSSSPTARRRRRSPIGEEEITTGSNMCCSPVMGSVLGRVSASLAEFCVVLTFGTLIFCFEQNASFLDGLYFAVQTTTTIGLGDLALKSHEGRLFAVFYIPVSFYVTMSLVGKLITLPLRLREDRARDRVRKRLLKTLTDESFRRLTNSGRRPDRISRDEFVIQMLLRLRKISLDDKDRCESLFNRLDKDRNGCIVAQDMAHSFGVRQQRALAAAVSKRHKISGGSDSPFKRSRLVFQDDNDHDYDDGEKDDLDYNSSRIDDDDDDDDDGDDDGCSIISGISGLSVSASTILKTTPTSAMSGPTSRKVGQKPVKVVIPLNGISTGSSSSGGLLSSNKKKGSGKKKKKKKKPPSPLARSIFRRVKKKNNNDVELTPASSSSGKRIAIDNTPSSNDAGDGSNADS